MKLAVENFEHLCSNTRVNQKKSGERVGEWKGVKASLRIPYNNKKYTFLVALYAYLDYNRACFLSPELAFFGKAEYLT